MYDYAFPLDSITYLNQYYGFLILIHLGYNLTEVGFQTWYDICKERNLFSKPFTR